jgi:Fur family ferric uptake transcriptional regulator
MISISRHSPPGFDERIRQAGFKLTRPRKAVADVLSVAEGALNPEQIQDRAALACPGIGLVTVYRTLALLSDLGCIRRIHQAEHCYGYARSSPGHAHHVICRSCDQVLEFPGSENIETIIDRVSRETGFRIDEHLLELMGTCPDCQQASKARGWR